VIASLAVTLDKMVFTLMLILASIIAWDLLMANQAM